VRKVNNIASQSYSWTITRDPVDNSTRAVLNALLSVVSHDRLDTDVDVDADQVAAADEMLAGDGEPPR
jgi:hypothetical protein